MVKICKREQEHWLMSLGATDPRSPALPAFHGTRCPVSIRVFDYAVVIPESPMSLLKTTSAAALTQQPVIL